MLRRSRPGLGLGRHVCFLAVSRPGPLLLAGYSKSNSNRRARSARTPVHPRPVHDGSWPPGVPCLTLAFNALTSGSGRPASQSQPRKRSATQEFSAKHSSSRMAIGCPSGVSVDQLVNARRSRGRSVCCLVRSATVCLLLVVDVCELVHLVSIEPAEGHQRGRVHIDQADEVAALGH